MEEWQEGQFPEGELDLSDDRAQHIAAKQDLIAVSMPRPLELIESPLTFSGEARGTWFFEGSFPVVLVNWDGLIIAESYATAQLDPEDPDSTWMTEDFVPFEGTLEFVDPSFAGSETDFSKWGTLIFQKNNPSDDYQLDDALEIPVLFAPLSQDL